MANNTLKKIMVAFLLPACAVVMGATKLNRRKKNKAENTPKVEDTESVQESEVSEETEAAEEDEPADETEA